MALDIMDRDSLAEVREQVMQVRVIRSLGIAQENVNRAELLLVWALQEQRIRELRLACEGGPAQTAYSFQ
jgi:hypothetical protein